MKRITKIEIENFKAFYGKYSPIELPNGENLLIYGENGSGKSSFCSALQIFFNSSENKSEPNIKNIQFNDYENIFLSDDKKGKGYIKLSFKNDDTPYIFQPEGSNNTEKFIKDANMLKGFLAYKNLSKLHAYAHNDIFYLILFLISQVRHTSISGNIGEAWEVLKNKIKDKRLKTEYGKVAGLLDTFNIALKDIILNETEGINKTANELLNYFTDNTEINLLVSEIKNNNGTDAHNRLYNKSIILKPVYSEKSLADYDKFLNEARLSAIAISIYFAVILKIPQESIKTKVLILDDIFVGLDSSNRLPVLKILKDYFSDYQIFIATYDRHWFEVSKRWFKNEMKDQWQYLEMYVDETEIEINGVKKKFDKPHLLPVEDSLLKAKDYLLKKDYPACGLYLRKKLEDLLEKILKPSYLQLKTPEDKRNYFTENKNLNDKIIGFEEFCNIEDIDFTPYKDLKLYKDILLNTLIHNDIKTPIYKNELLAIINVISKLEKIKVSEVIRANTELNFQIFENETEIFSVRFKLREAILLIKNGTETKISNKCLCKVTSIKKDNKITNNEVSYSSVQELYISECKKQNITNTPEILETIKKRNIKLSGLINT